MSAAVHGLLLFVVWVEGRLPDVVRPSQRSILTVPSAQSSPVVEMIYLPPLAPRARGGPAVAAPPAADNPAPAPAAPARPQARGAGRRAAADTTSGRPDASPTTDPADGPIGAIGPAYADGHLWRRPLPLAPKELAGRLTRSHAELADSAVTAVVQAFLDSVASEPNADRAAMPSWTKEVAGKTYGLDSQYLYIAGLKIPAAVLALLPIPATGNFDQMVANRRLQDMRADLLQAATRAENTAEFKRAIKEIRERKEREEEFMRNQRTAPPPETPATP